MPAYNNRMFVNALVERGEASFENTAAAAGADGLAEARSVVVFDYDDDGDQDVLVANIRPSDDTEFGDAPYLYQNVTASANWLKVQLEGTISNRDGIGAIVRAETAGDSYFRHNDGISFLGQSLAPLHFGLGAAQTVEIVEVSWPSGLVERFSDIEANQTVRFVEGQGVGVSTENLELPDGRGPMSLESAFPNPTSDRLKMIFRSSGSTMHRVTLFDTMGREAGSYELASGVGGRLELDIDLSDLPVGVYFVKVADGSIYPVIRAR